VSPEKRHQPALSVDTPGKPSGGVYGLPDRQSAKLLGDLRALIDRARESVARAVNSGLVILYWQIGKRIREDVLRNERAEYGEQIVSTLGRQLSLEYGKGFSEKCIRHTIRFAEAFPDLEIVSTLWRQLGWSHFKEIIYINDPLKRDFYAEMCRQERWSVRTLHEQIGVMLYERTGISKKPAELIKKELREIRAGKQSPDMVFRDPYCLDFLGLKDTYSEKDLESAILRHIQQVMTELGSDFAFIARQKRITLDNEDYYMDLLFYHRGMQCLVVVELKLDKFKPADKGQVELYLRWLEKYDMRAGEKPPAALILCAAKGEEMIELLQLKESRIRVAQYLTQSQRQVLKEKLHHAIDAAREQLTPATTEKPQLSEENPHGTSE
jgi:predicted nuclease of restriction endonuclease-like (RecB) superfamily